MQWHVSREAQDELAVASHHHLAAAYDRGFFDDLVTPDTALPFGGFKGSGFGRDLSLYALRNYAQPKAVWFDFRD